MSSDMNLNSAKINLPIDVHLESLVSLLQKHQNLVISAAPGSGKTTRLPPALLNHFHKKILVLEPRRIAALAAADRISQENNWQLGEQVGYQVRFDNCYNQQTRLLFLTEALLTRKMIDDPSLDDIDVIVLDEFHERSLHVDLAIGLIKELQQLSRPDLKMVIMSATLDVAKLKNTLPDTVCYEVPGQLYPLDLIYQKKEMKLQTRQDFIDNVCETTLSCAMNLAATESILVFLPGKSEIERCSEKFSELQIKNNIQNIQICKLHGQIPLNEQRLVLQKTQNKKIIFSTNIAESSLTVDGVRVVIDSGLQRKMSTHANTGFSQLEMGRISKASATQRSGRAARQAHGKCYRLWNKMDEISMPDHEPAEILTADLTSSLLFLAQQKISDFQSFSWFESPPKENINKACNELLLLEAIDEENKLTTIGMKILRLPIEPRLARVLIQAEKEGVLAEMCELAALLTENEARNRLLVSNRQSDHNQCDLWHLWEIYQEKGNSRIDQVTSQLLKIFSIKRNQHNKKWNPETLHKVLLSAYPDRLCRMRKNNQDHNQSQTARGIMIGGRGVSLSDRSQVKTSEFFIAMELFEGNKVSSNNETQVLLACGLKREFVEQFFSKHIKRNEQVILNEDSFRFTKKIEIIIDLQLNNKLENTKKNTQKNIQNSTNLQLSLKELQPQPVAASEIGDSLLLWTHEQFSQVQSQSSLANNLNRNHECLLVKKNSAFASWMNRYRFFLKNSENNYFLLTSEDWSSIADQICMGKSQPQEIFDCDIGSFIETHWGRELAQQFNEYCPDKITVPSGSRLPIDYQEENPTLSVRLQEIFGWSETPKIMQQKIPLLICLLAPNYRPVQITKDLKSFWANGYIEVKKELKTRYPKHSWPEDPLSAVAVAKGGVKR